MNVYIASPYKSQANLLNHSQLLAHPTVIVCESVLVYLILFSNLGHPLLFAHIDTHRPVAHDETTRHAYTHTKSGISRPSDENC